ncbi:MAG: DUF3141 domain-containing protein [Candidatus Competibacteraceae bacterium]|nr:MAG: DUF3141 domain-containing protein [Candidatus Competibacteraceae bacterium]
MTDPSQSLTTLSTPSLIPVPAQPAVEYWIDGWQRTILFWDVLRQRSDQYYAQKAQAVPHVLSFEHEPVLDGRTFARPVNYGLVRVKPPAGVLIDPLKRPFVVVDPRAGHGPGIGGFKADSELGVAMRAGHPAYFVGFSPDPMPGQTIEDIMKAEAVFLEKVIELHPQAEGKPCVIGNCQAGWAVLMVAATRPELFGPIIIPWSGCGVRTSRRAGVPASNRNGSRSSSNASPNSRPASPRAACARQRFVVWSTSAWRDRAWTNGLSRRCARCATNTAA